MPAHVLLVDAHEPSRSALKAALVAEGFDVTEARSSIEACALLYNQRQPITALVCAESLPPINNGARTSPEHAMGLVSMARMSFPTLRIFLVTAEPTPELERRAHVFDVIVIPATGAEAWACVAGLLQAPAPRPRNVVSMTVPASL